MLSSYAAVIYTEGQAAVIGYEAEPVVDVALSNITITNLAEVGSHTHPQSDITNLTTDLAAKAPLASPTFTGTVAGITKSMVGLGSVDNTSDASKPVSTAQQTALNLKANLASPALTGTPTAPTATVGTNTTQIATTAFVLANGGGGSGDVVGPASSAAGDIATFSNTTGKLLASSSTIAISKVASLQTSLDAKAPLASPTFTGTVAGITKTMVGLGSVDNTADTAKPVSTAQQTALNLKANLASPALTGTPTAPTAAPGTDTTQIATTAFVLANGGGNPYAEYGVNVYNSAGVDEGGYYAELSAGVAGVLTKFYAEIVAGDVASTVDVTVMIDDVVVHGPVTVTQGTPVDTTGLTLNVGEGDRIVFELADITGSVTEVFAKIHGNS